MKILILTPMNANALGGPAAVARELAQAWSDDTVEIVSFSSFERALPQVLRQGTLLVRLLLRPRPDVVLLFDPASTGPAGAFYARLLGIPSVLRIGGDFLWEAWVERTRTPLLLSEFYTQPRVLSLHEQLIRLATRLTLSLASTIVFTTQWQRELWAAPYHLDEMKVKVIANGMPVRPHGIPKGTVFLCAGRPTFIKNLTHVADLWPELQKEFPQAVLDTSVRAPHEYEAALMQAYAVIVPSLSDVSPNAILEAIAAGVPFITTRDTGIYPEYAQTGAFIDTRDHAAMLTALRTLLSPDGYRVATEALAKAPLRTWKQAARDWRAMLSV